MTFDSFQFFTFISVALIVYHCTRRTPLKRFVLFIINCVFIASFIKEPLEIIPLVLFLLLGYFFVSCLIKRPSGKLLFVFMAALILLFIYLKNYSVTAFIPSIDFSYQIIGLSYILFRIIQLMVDASGGMIKKNIGFFRYMNFACFFLNFVSGPIARYEDYCHQEDLSSTIKMQDFQILKVFSRMANGYIKILLIAPIFLTNYHQYEFVFSKLQAQENGLLILLWYAGSCSLYTLHMYFNFSGYMDVVIGIGKLFGMDLPENFDHPFRAENFLDFWSRWHITLSQWFKTYLFNPVTKVLMYRWPDSEHAPTIGVATYFITFFVMGLWHGTTNMFFVYGLLLGLGVSVNKWYQVVIRRLYGRDQYKRLRKNVIYHYLSRGLTFAYFSIALSCFWINLNQLHSIFHGGLLLNVILALMLAGVISGVILFILDWFVVQLTMIREKKISLFLMNNIGLALKLWVILYVIIYSINPSVEFIYQRF